MFDADTRDEGQGQTAFEALAMILFQEIDKLESGGENWGSISGFDRDFYRFCIGAIFRHPEIVAGALANNNSENWRCHIGQ